MKFLFYSLASSKKFSVRIAVLPLCMFFKTPIIKNGKLKLVFTTVFFKKKKELFCCLHLIMVNNFMQDFWLLTEMECDLEQFEWKVVLTPLSSVGLWSIYGVCGITELKTSVLLHTRVGHGIARKYCAFKFSWIFNKIKYIGLQFVMWCLTSILNVSVLGPYAFFPACRTFPRPLGRGWVNMCNNYRRKIWS